MSSSRDVITMFSGTGKIKTKKKHGPSIHSIDVSRNDRSTDFQFRKKKKKKDTKTNPLALTRRRQKAFFFLSSYKCLYMVVYKYIYIILYGHSSHSSAMTIIDFDLTIAILYSGRMSRVTYIFIHAYLSYIIIIMRKKNRVLSTRMAIQYMPSTCHAGIIDRWTEFHVPDDNIIRIHAIGHVRVT